MTLKGYNTLKEKAHWVFRVAPSGLLGYSLRCKASVGQTLHLTIQEKE